MIAEDGNEQWTYKEVKRVLVEAERRLRKTMPRVGPRGDQAFWVNYRRDYADKERKHRGYERWMTVERMEHVMEGWRDAAGAVHPAWLSGPLLAYPEFREKLVAWVDAVIADESSVDLCVRKGWSLATFKRHRDRAAAMIAERLNRARVPLW